MCVVLGGAVAFWAVEAAVGVFRTANDGVVDVVACYYRLA